MLLVLEQDDSALRLMDPHAPQEVVFEWNQIQQQRVAIPCAAADDGARDGVEDEVVRGRDDRDQNDSWVCDAKGQAEESSRRRKAQTQAF